MIFLLAILAHATPENHVTSAVEVVCAGDDVAVFTLYVRSNAGTYHADHHRWLALTLDPAADEVQGYSLGRLLLGTDPMTDEPIEPTGVDLREHPPGPAEALAAVPPGARGARCPPDDASRLPWGLGRFAYGWRGSWAAAASR